MDDSDDDTATAAGDDGLHTEDVLKGLARVRRRRRVAQVDRFEALYQTYVTGLLGTLGAVLLSNLAGDTLVSPAQRASVEAHGAAFIGLAVAVVIAVGVRSGGRGGPLALAAADVRHVLMAPVDRTAALRGPAVRQLRFAVVVGAGIGAVCGLNAGHRLPRPVIEWILAGGLVGAVTAVAALGAALCASGRRLGRLVSGALALLVLGWSVADVAFATRTSPMSFLGGIALWPLAIHTVDLVGLTLLLLVPAGLAGVGGTSLEASERRSALVGQLRFAATLQDVRTVLVLRRQLSQEAPRSRPWLPQRRVALILDGVELPAGGATGAARAGTRPAAKRKTPVLLAVRRSLFSVGRWPLGRVARTLTLTAAGAASLVGVWKGTTALVAVAAVALYLVSLDAIEPLAQEIDRPDRPESTPLAPGEIRLWLLVVPIVLVAVLAVLGGLGITLATGQPAGLSVAAALALPIGVLGCCAAAFSTIKGPDVGDVNALLQPEMANLRTGFRLGFPLLLCGASLLPVLAARSAFEEGRSASAAALGTGMFPLLILGVVTLGWIRFREDLSAQLAQAGGLPGALPPAGDQ